VRASPEPEPNAVRRYLTSTLALVPKVVVDAELANALPAAFVAITVATKVRPLSAGLTV